jgi:glutamine synthetase
MMLGTPNDVVTYVRKQEIETVDFRFVDLLGMWHHFAIPSRILSEDTFAKGIAFDASSIRAWAPVHQSDMLVRPDPATAFVDPFYDDRTLVMVCDVLDPVTKGMYPRDPRNVARRAEAFLAAQGFADTAYFGPEGEFFVFDGVRFQSAANKSGYEIDSEEGYWSSSMPGPVSGIRPKEGYFPVPPLDRLHNLRNEMTRVMEACGIPVEKQHHEVAGAGQCEIDIAYDTLTHAADKMMLFKYICKGVAHRHQKIVTFMPKPVVGDNGTAMHVHFSLWQSEIPLFAGNRYGGLSTMAHHAIGGLLKHAGSLLAFSCPSTNSYRRLIPGYEAPTRLTYSARNRSACCRVPIGQDDPRAKRIEFRPPDPTSNPYLCFAAILMAAIDGIRQQMDPGDPLETDMCSPETASNIPNTPRSLDEALDCLEHDHEYLLQGDVFNTDLIDAWVNYKRRKECDAVRMHPHPHEFYLYFDT